MSAKTVSARTSAASKKAATTVVPATPDVTPTPATDVYAEFVATYRSADKSEKAAMRKTANASMMSAIDAMDIIVANAWKKAIADATSAPSVSTEPTDYNRIVADRVIALRLAASAIMNDLHVPAGIDMVSVDMDVVSGMVATAMESDMTDEMAKTVETIATARITRTGGTRRDLGNMIESYMRTTGGEYRSISDIRRNIATDDYVPSDGAIGARLFPTTGTCTLAGIVPVSATSDSPRGARYVA